MQIDKEQKEERPRNTETRELFLGATTDDLPTNGLLTPNDSEPEKSLSEGDASVDE